MSTNEPTIASDLLPVGDSAAYLGVSPRTLETLIAKGHLRDSYVYQLTPDGVEVEVVSYG